MAAGDDGQPADVGLECILGRCDSLRAEVYIRGTLPPSLDAATARLTGTFSGPECRRAITLPVTAKLTAMPAPVEAVRSTTAHTVPARVILTEPSFWTPELPNLYTLDVRCVDSGREVAAWRRKVGLRRLGVRGRSLWLDGRRFVPRGLAASADGIDIAAFRAAALAAVVADPSETFLDRCDAEGVPVIALLADGQGRPLDIAVATAAIARWVWHPAVLVAVVPGAASTDQVAAIAASAGSRKGTLQLGREADGRAAPVAVTDGIDLLLVTVPPGELPHEAWQSEPPAVPLLARRTGEPPCREPSRRGCDAWQADLAAWRADRGPAPWPDWAGYIVG